MDEYATMATIDAIDISGSEHKPDRNGDAERTKALHAETPQVVEARRLVNTTTARELAERRR